MKTEIISQTDGGLYTDHITDGSDIPEGHSYLLHCPVGLMSALRFQNGPIKEVGVNGTTSEEVLKVLIHRTTVLNNKFPCKENETALYHLNKALDAFNDRTKNRQARGVEGLNKV